jgi:hypothetical protein
MEACLESVIEKNEEETKGGAFSNLKKALWYCFGALLVLLGVGNMGTLILEIIDSPDELTRNAVPMIVAYFFVRYGLIIFKSKLGINFFARKIAD